MEPSMPCCAPVAGQTRQPRAVPARSPVPIEHDDVALPGGTFLMGDAFGEGYPADGETPVHPVRLAPFPMDATAVTVAMFEAFTRAGGYRTDAELAGHSAVFRLAVAATRADILGFDPALPWWATVAGADWRHPFGPLSRAEPGHPVVHVSWNDAIAYCAWAGRRLPTEAQWEYAARGGLAQRRFAWGQDLTPGGRWMCNIWQGSFPHDNTGEDGWLATAPVRSYPANGYGLYEMSGNVWEWCADWFSAASYADSAPADPEGPPAGERKVIRGGSYLCHDSYCHRYRVAARSANSPDSTSGNCGFRTTGPS
ncbi:formylglycine-generating enzyme family protein [Nonomuraea endophytica]|uniref:formylglycine-generating enzyme family protein n=1 Tax=Nonomuraea endophytica TaxID=714136 RepID=UPI0037CA4D2F